MADATDARPAAPSTPLPPWAGELVELYESGASNQFLVFGNVQDRMVITAGGTARLADLRTFLLDVLLPRFDVVLSYDLGNGIRVEKGGRIFSSWPTVKDAPSLPRAPRQAIEFLTQYFRYCANLGRLGQSRLQVACLLFGADLVVPAANPTDFELGAIVSLIRDWANEDLLSGHALAAFLVCENLHDLHPLVMNNLRTARIRVPLPSAEDLAAAFTVLASEYPGAAPPEGQNIAQQLAGATVGALERVVLAKSHARQCLKPEDIVALKKSIIEDDCNGLIDFLEPRRTLDSLYGLDAIKTWLRQDIALWAKNDIDALPKGYLICGPVGTGKTFLVECLAGEAGVPVVKMKNFRDRWVGSTEGNLEKIFRLIHALGRCYVFVDEADQALGRRDAGSGDSGVSGRVYSMLAEEMGSSSNRGKVIWVLASSRPDLIEVDLKRPGRIDVKLPIFPTTTAREGFDLLRALMRARGMNLDDTRFTEIESAIPLRLTPGAAETLAVKVYRDWRTRNLQPFEVLRAALKDYRNPVPADIMQAQIRLAVREASDVSFVPAFFADAADTR
jgi:hypothetical protein